MMIRDFLNFWRAVLRLNRVDPVALDLDAEIALRRAQHLPIRHLMARKQDRTHALLRGAGGLRAGR